MLVFERLSQDEVERSSCCRCLGLAWDLRLLGGGLLRSSLGLGVGFGVAGGGAPIGWLWLGPGWLWLVLGGVVGTGWLWVGSGLVPMG